MIYIEGNKTIYKKEFLVTQGQDQEAVVGQRSDWPKFAKKKKKVKKKCVTNS